MSHWKPNTDLDVLKCRAALLQAARLFFSENNTLEVDTPTLSQSTVTDPNIESFTTQFNNTRYYLHTSPEFPMKRLLAAGSGAIYQICKVFRQGEAGRNHNPEFTMIEWYQPGMHYHALMQQLEQLVRLLLTGKLELNASISFTYQQVFEKFIGINPYAVNEEQLKTVLQDNNIKLFNTEIAFSKDALLDLIITTLIQPKLPTNCPVFIVDYPESQAALANIRQTDVNVAERFELYINGVELANGYQELLDANEQQQRFEKENNERKKMGLPVISIDTNLIAALKNKMPMVSGVALGLDRLLMLALGADSIQDVIAFPIDKA